MLKVSCNVVVGAGLLGIYDHFLELFLKKIVPQRFQQLLQRPNWLVCKRHFGVHEAEVVAFRRLKSKWNLLQNLNSFVSLFIHLLKSASQESY